MQAVQMNELEADRIFIVPNALEWSNDISASSVSHTLPQGTRLLSVGRLDSTEQQKGFDTVIESLPDVIKQVPDLQYLIVGTGSDLERHRELAAKVGVSDRVHFLGTVDETVLQDCYKSCDLFVMPSAQEGFGFVYLEAMQYHKAIVAANSGGVPEVVEDNITGRLIDYGNKDQLVHALVDLLTDSDRRRRLGNTGYQKLQEKFTFPQFRRTLSDILRREIPPSAIYRSRREALNSA
jgi:glycosyltransferase involved in cell wall biosynthesis